jgi:DNA-binding Lrp family transcriptional regulator
MRLQEVLRGVAGLEKRFVHYLESQGYIHPRKLQKARIARRDYSEFDLERIRAIWSYYQRGISVQRAYELITRAAVDGAFVFFPAPAGRWREALQVLHSSEHVMEAAAIYGERANVIARLRAPHDSDVHAVLDRLVEERIIAGLPEVWRFAAGERWTPPSAADQASTRSATLPRVREHSTVEALPASPGSRQTGGGTMMRAWVLIKVPAKQIGGLVDELKSYPGVVEAAAIYGETDVIAKVEVPDQDALDELVIDRIQSLGAVESTRTFIAVGGLHWRRD